MVEDLISAYAYTHAWWGRNLEECLIDGVGLLKESRKASYPQQAEAKPQYHPSKCASIESDCKEQNRTLAAFLPKPPNTGFGDVRCRIGAERLFIYFILFFFFHLFGSFSTFVVYLTCLCNCFIIFCLLCLSKTILPCCFFSEGAFF